MHTFIPAGVPRGIIDVEDGTACKIQKVKD